MDIYLTNKSLANVLLKEFKKSLPHAPDNGLVRKTIQSDSSGKHSELAEGSDPAEQKFEDKINGPTAETDENLRSEPQTDKSINFQVKLCFLSLQISFVVLVSHKCLEWIGFLKKVLLVVFL